MAKKNIFKEKGETIKPKKSRGGGNLKKTQNRGLNSSNC